MNVAVHPAPAELALDAGQSLALDDRETGFLIRSGRLEIYAQRLSDGAPASGRHFLLELKAGDLIPPPLAGAEGLALTAIIGEPATLMPVARAHILGLGVPPEHLAALCAQLDRWIVQFAAALARILGPNPAGTVAQAAGETFAPAEGGAVTLRSGTAWCVSPEAELVTALGEPAPRVGAERVTPLAPGLWITARTVGTVGAVSTAVALQQTFWPEALAQFHHQAFAFVAHHLVERDAALLELAQARGDRTERTLDRTLGRFAGVMDHAPAWTGAAAPDERLLGPFVMVCEELGIELPQRVRELIRRTTTVEEAARAARVRQRQIALRGRWWREDFGPFIGFLDEERRPAAVIPAGAGRYRLIDPDGGKDLVVDAKVAARLQPQGYMLYRPLAARPVTLKDVLFLGWKQNRGDVLVALVGSLAIALLGLATPLAMRLAFDRFIPSHETLQLTQLALGLALAAVISAGFKLAYDMALLRIDGRMGAQTQAAVIDRILRLPPAALRFTAADLAQRALAVDGVRRTTVGFVLGTLAAGLSWIFNAALMAYYAPLATVVVALCFVLLIVIVHAVATRQREAQRRGEEILSDVNTLVFHLIKGIGVLRTSGAEARAFARWGHDFAEMRARAYRSQRVSSLLETLLAGFDVLTMAGVFLILAGLPAKDFSTGAFISFVSAYGVFIACSIQIARGVTAYVNSKPSWERAAPLLRNIPEGGIARRDPGTLTGAVELTNVAFRYGADSPMVLSGLSLKVAPGEFVALAGASGSGKSTTAKLLLGNLAPLAGAVQYDGMELQHLDMQLVRRQIGVVLQNGKLMPGSIFENIMGAHHGTLDDAWEAARQAGIEADIKSLPMGMHTILTEASAAFSGGQIQRFMIARALVGKPRILILDEATSALDNVTQAIVTAALSRLAVTRIVIAHRLSTVRNADRICVFDGGRVVQSGTYDELIATQGPFAELARRQLI